MQKASWSAILDKHVRKGGKQDWVEREELADNAVATEISPGLLGILTLRGFVRIVTN